MNIFKLKNFIQRSGINILIVFSFLFWCFLFRGFLLGELHIISDALPYYQHIQFFIKNMSGGVYPLWDPTWYLGIDNEFFLRRMGEFNPFYLLILVLFKVGIPFFHSYMTFLIIYYFIGLIGFYLLSRRIFLDEKIAFAAYLLLMFSSLGTHLFYNFMILIFVPTVWFF